MHAQIHACPTHAQRPHSPRYHRCPAPARGPQQKPNRPPARRRPWRGHWESYRTAPDAARPTGPGAAGSTKALQPDSVVPPPPPTSRKSGARGTGGPPAAPAPAYPPAGRPLAARQPATARPPPRPAPGHRGRAAASGCAGRPAGLRPPIPHAPAARRQTTAAPGPKGPAGGRAAAASHAAATGIIEAPDGVPLVVTVSKMPRRPAGRARFFRRAVPAS